MQQAEKSNPPKSTKFWLLQQRAEFEFELFINSPQNDETFDNFFNHQLTDLNDLSPLNDKAIFLTYLLIYYFEDKNFSCNSNEITWVKEKFQEVQEMLVPPPACLKGTPATPLYNPIFYAATGLAMLYGAFNFAKDNRNSLSLMMAITIMGLSVCLLNKANTNFSNMLTYNSALSFWNKNKKNIPPEIQTLFDYLDNKIQQTDIKLKID